MTAPRPVIGLTTSEIRLPGRAEQIPHADAGRHELVLGLSYMQALGAAGAAPVILAPLDPDDVPAMLSSLSGVCLPGGPDIDPVEYGAERDADLGPTDRALDLFELAVARGAERLGMPLLALCRGIQTLNVAHGGDLYQHLPRDPGGELRHQRDRPTDPGLEHEVTIDPDSQLGRLLGTDRLVVNSFHHQAVRRLGEGLRAVAWASDGLVEGVEDPRADFRIGVQWHAEAMTERRDQLALFRAFVEAAGRYAASASSTARTAEASQRS